MTNPTTSMAAPVTTTGVRLHATMPVERWGTTGFPGRWVGGTAMVLGPLLMLAGAVARARFPFFFPDQLAAYERHPALMATAYGLFAAGSLLLWPAVAVLAARIGAHSAGWGLWGGVLVMFGLFARAFHAGVDHMAFQLVRSQGAGPATEAVSAGYGAFHVFATLNLAIVAGWIVIALGAWRTRVLGPVRAAALGLTAALPLGVLKGTTPLSLVALAGLCVALVPLGLALLSEGPRPGRAVVLRWVPLTLVTVALMMLLGQAG
ncbi:hypothetical protein SLINC_3677 [Streptomyces lincolnensis]|uniref:Uncharacterized protein n=1 Tax=Streptomyces lincolnensis TaxID=1915 RepID=A0A1B1MBC7_STRLN|nr:hypothetical protein [Streptomyces lincolnensis]ANS65901.1 hypothetical protein SLINC_3677 [Streptomyces lincolnensis]AXG54336.1 hypothetical protein SLCG_3181 [Streptomyces lincolnensis]QMV08714.1 hypothetical protein GJU35_25760 [Streptomyces lincolnensis]